MVDHLQRAGLWTVCRWEGDDMWEGWSAGYEPFIPVVFLGGGFGAQVYGPLNDSCSFWRGAGLWTTRDKDAWEAQR